MLGARLIDVLHEPHLVTCLSTNAGDFFRQALRLLPPFSKVLKSCIVML